MPDVRRYATYVRTRQIAGGATVDYVPADPARVALLFVPNTTQALVVAPAGVTLSVGGLNIPAASAGLMVLWRETGPLCQMAWGARNAGALATFFWVETLEVG